MGNDLRVVGILWKYLVLQLGCAKINNSSPDGPVGPRPVGPVGPVGWIGDTSEQCGCKTASQVATPNHSGPVLLLSSPVLTKLEVLFHREAVSGSGRVLYRTAPWDSRQTHTPQTDQTSFFGTFLIFSDPIQSMN